MPEPFLCSFCDNTVPPSAERCPHCARPGLFPNVRAAEDAEERAALDERYNSAYNLAANAGTSTPLVDFEAAAASSSAVLNRSISDLQRLITSDNEIYVTFYELTKAGLRLPEGSKWDVLRSVADSALFPNYKEHVRFAALSLDGTGLLNYGECSITLRNDMIAHRASVFEENSILFMKNHKIAVWDADKLPKGYRATWKDRGRLSAAKLYSKITAATTTEEYPRILLKQDQNSEKGEFIEVHIWGPLTVRTVESVIFTRQPNTAQGILILKAIEERLATFKVRVS